MNMNNKIETKLCIQMIERCLKRGEGSVRSKEICVGY